MALFPAATLVFTPGTLWDAVIPGFTWAFWDIVTLLVIAVINFLAIRAWLGKKKRSSCGLRQWKLRDMHSLDR